MGNIATSRCTICLVTSMQVSQIFLFVLFVEAGLKSVLSAISFLNFHVVVLPLYCIPHLSYRTFLCIFHAKKNKHCPPPNAQQPLGGQGLLIIKVSGLYSFRHNTLGGTPLDEWSARHRNLYLTTHNTLTRHSSMPRRDSNPQSQQASGRRPTPQTARPLGSANPRDSSDK